MRRSVGAAIGAIGVWTMPSAAIASERTVRLFGMQTHLEDRKAIALTFDDGPHPEGTEAILDALTQLGTGATFFLTGE